jgi:hypothetical protein
VPERGRRVGLPLIAGDGLIGDLQTAALVAANVLPGTSAKVPGSSRAVMAGEAAGAQPDRPAGDVRHTRLTAAIDNLASSIGKGSFNGHSRRTTRFGNSHLRC